jgi:hypothetical protein
VTRFLSTALQAEEPRFQTGLRQLESAHGNPSTDIRLSSEIMRATQNKLRELGLDPLDTTAAELYHALQLRVAKDDALLTKHLRTQAAQHISAEADVVAGMIRAMRQLSDSQRCFALKASSLRTLLKRQPPKKAMKRLGYRSLASFLKHESPALALAAAWLCEGEAWQKHLLAGYKVLASHDFEARNISLVEPTSKHWRELASSIITERRHTVLSFKELGAIIIFPMPEHDVPPGAVTATLSLALHDLNEIRAASTFLKLNQMKSDFGQIVRYVAMDEPRLDSKLLDQPLPWNLIQRYYSRVKDQFKEAVFEPYVQLEDMNWYAVEKALATIDPDLKFWQHTAYLGLLDEDRAPVSMNIVDAALNYCNKLPFERRLTHYFQRSLWHELLLRYLRHEPVEQAVLSQLQPQIGNSRVPLLQEAEI